MSPVPSAGSFTLIPKSEKAVSWREPLCDPTTPGFTTLLHASLPHENIKALLNWRRDRGTRPQRPEAVVVGFSIHRSTASEEELGEWPKSSRLSVANTGELRNDGTTSVIGNGKAKVEIHQRPNINEGHEDDEEWVLKVYSIQDDPEGREKARIHCP